MCLDNHGLFFKCRKIRKANKDFQHMVLQQRSSAMFNLIRMVKFTKFSCGTVKD